jgi:hypothetical protein
MLEMMKRVTFLVSALCLLILANVLMMSVASPAFAANGEGFAASMMKDAKVKGKEGFSNYGPHAAGARSAYEPMGQYDNVVLPTGNSSSWRHTAPNEPLNGPPVELGPDNLFMFKNNQCKPECCGSSWSCDGGCVCTTPDQREFINTRGGNRTRPESGV